MYRFSFELSCCSMVSVTVLINSDKIKLEIILIFIRLVLQRLLFDVNISMHFFLQFISVLKKRSSRFGFYSIITRNSKTTPPIIMLFLHIYISCMYVYVLKYENLFIFHEHVTIFL